jgi:hypothetical protein
MTKKGKKRFFILRNTFLMWYQSEVTEVGAIGKVLGSIAMSGCKITLEKEPLTFLLVRLS